MAKETAAPTAQDQLAALGITFVEDADVPAPPRIHDRDDARWSLVKEILASTPGKFARVKVYDKPGSAASKASAINGDRNKQFPADSYEARYEKDENGSTLYLRLRG